MQPSTSGSWLRALCRVPRHQTQENIVNDTTSPLPDDLPSPDCTVPVRTATPTDEIAKLAAAQVGQRLTGAFEVWTHMRARLAGRPVEEFWVIAMDVRHRVVLDRMLARGSLTGVEVHPRDVFRPLIKSGAAAAIFCHNHPSGDPSPSRQDIELTTRLREVGDMCGIAVLDHVVVGWEGYVSLAERNWR
jgi:DNA repair protein RadC